MKDQAGQQNLDSRPRAIGLVRGEVSGLAAPRHALAVQRHAVGLGCQYLYTVRPPQDHDDPVGYALGMAAGLSADVVVVYDLATVNDSPARVCDMFDLETVNPPETWTRVHESGPDAESVRSAACAAGNRVAR